MNEIPILLLHCPKCTRPVKKETSVSLGDEHQLGDLFLCGDCAAVSTYTTSGLRLLTEKEFTALSKEERKDLNFAVRSCLAVGIQNRNKVLNQLFILKNQD